MLLDTVPRDERCIRTYSGRDINLRAPLAAQIDIGDIAHGLAYQCINRGQVRYFHSLAQHCLLVASLVPAPQRLAALLYLAPAAYLGDSADLLSRLVPDYGALEKRLAAAIAERFGLGETDTPAIRRAIQVASATEQRDLLPHLPPPPETGRVRSLASAPVPRRIEFMPPEEARYQFLERYAAYSRQGGACPTPLPVARAGALHAVSDPQAPPAGDVPAARKSRSRHALTLVGHSG